MVKIELAESAYEDLEAIEAYIAQDSPTIARNFINKIFGRVEVLYNHPESGRKVPEFNDDSIRQLLLGKYRIIYRLLKEEEIVILRIVHSSRLLDLE